MIQKIAEYLDKVIEPTELIRKRIKTGEYVRGICKNIERAIDEVYKTPPIADIDVLELNENADDLRTYFFYCIHNTPTSGGYFGMVYFHIVEDFYYVDGKYETSIEIVFSETEPRVGDYDIWDDESTTVWVKVGPDGYTVEYTPVNDPEHYPTITGDSERIKKFIEILKDDSWMTIPSID